MNSMTRIFATAALLAATTVFADDDDVEEGPDTRPVVYIDAGAIENKTDNAGANFSGLIDRLDNALVECGVYRVLNSKSVSNGVKDDDIFKVVADDGGKESKIETPGFKIYMTIMQYGFAKSGGQDMYGRSSETRQAKIELILKVVDMRTKETLKSKNISRSATGTATAAANLEEQTLQTANKQVVNDIVSELVSLTPFNVLDVENGEVVVDVPSSRVKPGQQLLVYKKGKKIKNKRTGKVSAKESQVAVIGVVTLSEDSVTCKLLSGEIKPDADAEEGAEYDKYIVRIAETAASPVPSVPAPQPANSAAVPF